MKVSDLLTIKYNGEEEFLKVKVNGRLFCDTSCRGKAVGSPTRHSM
jgi:hypothetical protein